MSNEICQSCKKAPATIHMTEIVKGKKRELHYCEACAEKAGLDISTPQSLLSSLAEPAHGSGGEEKDFVCPRCSLRYSEFRRRGRLGCGDCYQTFREGLVPLLERIHGNVQHLGRIPARAGARVESQRELTELKRELTRAVQREEYERAAEIRDRIRKAEERSGRGND
ncbi:MAG: UvrB/UvrC motif-containing protein [Planctomycetes bacterium]|nr:UvrB/UvrC motif-containing protein [Planctomycetota bacterium]